MAVETHRSSSSSSTNYDVFLNFRGEDTRRNFTDHLYAGLLRVGLRTFRDNEELNQGEEIGPELLKAIEESRISVPVFSKTYASSKWCLQELAKIMECKKKSGQIVLPVFYKVDPSLVRNQTGSFAEAFLEHEEKQCKEKVEKWREALREAANLKGWNSEDPENSEEANLINFVVERALSESIKTTLQVAKHPIGIDSHVEEMMRLLDVESKDVQFVGIHGMGGIGKTTIAKAVFNRIFCHFQGWSFLEDVRERASQREGLVNLQNKLVSDILKGKDLGIDIVDGGINKIKKILCNMKILIILDDVDEDQQLNALAGGRDWFGGGSRIIVTTRDEHIVNVDQVDISKIYKPKVLDPNRSFQLFSNHAFGRDIPPQDFRELSEKIVSIAGGLPLALEVLGSFLRDKRMAIEWESTLKRLKKIPDYHIQKKLKVSYDGLNELEREIFLDIACFFIGIDEESAIHVWEDCDFFPRIGIKVLLHKSLVKIDDDNKLRMHDQLRDMGREIVRQESPKNPGKRSRLWCYEEALDVLKKHKGTTNVESFLLKFGYESKDRCLRIESFEEMTELRLLQVDHADLVGNGHLPGGLKWLSCKGLQLKCIPTISHLEKLVVLDMSQSMITEDWNGWQQIQMIKTLKVLDLSGCFYLTRTPNFSTHRSLERLVLDNCRRLVACHESIGHLKKLVFLSLKSCRNLMELPDNICKLSSIKTFILSGCASLEKLPKALGTMKCLTELTIDETAIKQLPDAIGSLEKLERLSARNCKKLVKLSHSMGKLRLLHYFDMTGTGIVELPEDFGMLSSLEEFKMASCREFKGFPENFGNLARLSILDANSCTGLQSLPELPSSLIKLNAMGCVSMERLPNLSALKNLRGLCLDRCKKLVKIQGIYGLSQLQQLDLKNCINLEPLPVLPPSLVRLDIRDCLSMSRLPNLSSLKYLKDLCLDNCRNLAKIEGINGLTLIQTLQLTHCRCLQSLSELPSSLTRLNVCGCMSMWGLPDLSNLKKLRELHILQCENLCMIPGISGLPLLEKLSLLDCRSFQSLPKLPSSLVTLHVGHCSSIERLPDLSNLKFLKNLSLECCHSLAGIQGLESLESLNDLRVCGCHTYVNTLLKTLAKGTLSCASSEGEIPKSYLIPDDDSISRTILYLVYLDGGGFENTFSVTAEIQRIDGKKIRCHHDLMIDRVVVMSVNFDAYYFQGLTWFGFPLKCGDKIEVTGSFTDSIRTQPKERVSMVSQSLHQLKMIGFVAECEAMKYSPQLEKLLADLTTSAQNHCYWVKKRDGSVRLSFSNDISADI